VDSIVDSFFAGCTKYDMYELGIKFNTIPTRDLFTYQQILNNPRLTNEELGQVAFEIPVESEVVTTGNAENATGQGNGGGVGWGTGAPNPSCFYRGGGGGATQAGNQTNGSGASGKGGDGDNFSGAFSIIPFGDSSFPGWFAGGGGGGFSDANLCSLSQAGGPGGKGGGGADANGTTGDTYFQKGKFAISVLAPQVAAVKAG
jgi:hypothetical protein